MSYNNLYMFLMWVYYSLFALGVKHICWSDHLCLGYLHHSTIITIIANTTRTPTINTHIYMNTNKNTYMCIYCSQNTCPIYTYIGQVFCDQVDRTAQLTPSL